MASFLILGGCTSIVLLLLLVERWAMHRIRAAIPLRIVVIGTRGKTSVTRLIAAGLRGGDQRVLAKSTGSLPRVILPTAEERSIRRRGPASPLEQRRVLLWAARQRCDAVVVEGMSIRPESLRSELRQIICPHVVVITNTYEDHLAETDNPAVAFVDAIPTNASVFLPRDFPRAERDILMLRNSSILDVDEPDATNHSLERPPSEWPQNLLLALAVCGRAGVPPDKALQGMSCVRMDVGQLASWRVRADELSPSWMAINAFAANDPESTMAVLHRAKDHWPMNPSIVVGLLNLRHDRGDRTLQWIEALGKRPSAFDRMIVCGAVPWSVQRRLERYFGKALTIARSADPTIIMQAAGELSPEGGYLFGFGNIGGVGLRMLKYWQDKGEPA